MACWRFYLVFCVQVSLDLLFPPAPSISICVVPLEVSLIELWQFIQAEGLLPSVILPSYC